MLRKFKKAKKGAASFYIVAFSTLILVVIATSFALVIMSEVARTSNDDLSQSAYDSALAGVEDAKVAYSNYRRCAETGARASSANINSGSVTCADIMYWVEHPDCYTVGHILGKIPKGKEGEVTIGGVTKSNAGGETTTNQAYTCVMINTSLADYRATLDKSKRVQTIRAGVGNGPTNTVTKLKLSWYSVRNDVQLTNSQYQNFDTNNNRVVFPAFRSTVASTPPTVELQLVQTRESFTLQQFDQVGGTTQTNRGTLFLVPTWRYQSAKVSGDNYIGTYTGSNGTNGVNRISKAQVVKTNDHSVMNKAFVVYCSTALQNDFYCSAEIELPDPIGGLPRSNSTFMLSVSLPYQNPDTDFSVEICDASNRCGATAVSAGSNVKISNSQIAIDSTGRANDLYRRVETRLETSDTTFNTEYPYYALEILNDPSSVTVKTMKAGVERGFYF